MLALIGLIGVSFALRLLGGLGRPTVNMVPDEYIYSELSRSLAFSLEPLIRGHLAHCPSLGFPLLGAPLSAFGDHELVYKLTQALNALIASLAAIPDFLLARELRLGLATNLGVRLPEIELTPPSGIRSERINVKTPRGVYRVRLASGHSSKVSIRLRGNRSANIVVRSNRFGSLYDGRFVIAQARFRLA